MGSLLLAAVGATVVLTGSVSASPPAESAVAGWPRQLGSSQYDYISSTAVTGAGDVYVVGSTFAALPGNTHLGFSDSFVARYDKYGKLVWVRQFGTSGQDNPAGVAVSGSSIFITGHTNGAFPTFTNAGDYDGFVARYSTSGAQSWVRQFGTAAYDESNAVAVSGSSVYLAGNTEGAFPTLTNAGDHDGFVARYSTSGAQTWLRQFGTAAYDESSGVAVSGGAVYVTGNTAGSFPTFTNAGNRDGFLTRFSSAGAQAWATQFGTAGDDRPAGLAALGGALYLTGPTSGTFPTQTSAGDRDGFLARYSSAGAQAWLRQFGTNSKDVPTGVGASGGSLYVTGFTEGAFPGFANAGENDGFLVRYSNAGVSAWARQFGTGSDDYPYAVAVRSNDSYGGGVVVAGETAGTVWGQASAGNSDAFVATFLK